MHLNRSLSYKTKQKISNTLRTLGRKKVTLISIGIFATIGTLIVAFSSAATVSISFEPENGTKTSCAAPEADSTASGRAAIVFGTTATGVLSLDSSGKTIPKTCYAIPAGAIYMSPSGTDKNSNSVDGNDNSDGSSASNPVKTINRAIALVPAGGVIVMRGGEYRDWNYSGNTISFQEKSFNLQAYPNESPWFNGADIVTTDWKSEANNTWSRTWETPDFCGIGQYYLPADGSKPPFSPTLADLSGTQPTACAWRDSVRGSTTVAGDPQSVFINDTKLAQVPTLAQVTSSSFYYDWGTRKMYIGQDPTSNKVELSKRTQALMLNKTASSIKGIGFKRYASGGFGSTNGTGNWTIASAVFMNEPISSNFENTVFADNGAIGLGYSWPQNSASKITSSVFAYNGYAGLHANGRQKTGGRDDFSVTSSVFNANNDQSFDINCDEACGAANLKFNNMVGFTLKDNVATNAKPGGYGLWCDVHCSDGVIVNNLVKNNAKVGIFYEISRDGLIASNMVVDNGYDGIAVTAANTNIYNNTVIFDRSKSSVARGLNIFDDGRCSICYRDPGIGPDTRNVELVNNIVVARSGGELSVNLDRREDMGLYGTPSTNTNTRTSQIYDKFDYNAYHRTAPNTKFYVWRFDNGTIDFNISSTAAFKAATGWDTNSLDITGSTIPFFMDMANGDFRLRTDSQPYTNKGSAIPKEVTTKLGIQENSVLPRGAITWPR